jgi:hypothetical protein
MLRVFSKAVFLQVLAFLAVSLWVALTDWPSTAVGAVIAISLLAAVGAWIVHSGRWWMLIHAGFPWAIYAALQAQISPAWHLAAFIALALVYYPVARNRVPLYLTHAAAFDSIHQQIQAESRGRSRIRVIDLGSGTGGLLSALAQSMPQHEFVGVEAAPIPWLISRWRSRNTSNLVFKRADFWREDLSGFQVVYAFLSPEPMPRLWKKASQEMAQGTLLLSNTFEVPGQRPEKSIALPGSFANRLYLYRMGQRK